MLACGIDPGVYGAIAALDESGGFAGVWRLPKEWPARIELFADIIWRFEPAMWFVEQQQGMPRQGRAAIAAQMAGYGQICGALGAMRQRFEPIWPFVWRRACNLKRGAGKDAALSMASKRWPSLLPAMDGWRMLSKEGGADAALIALGGMRLSGMVRADNKSGRAS